MKPKPYMPSNSSEGEWFEANYCARCVHDKAFREAWADDSIPDVEGCEIIARAQRGDQPPEWIEDEHGPRCTAFELIDGETPPDDLTDDMFGDDE